MTDPPSPRLQFIRKGKWQGKDNAKLKIKSWRLRVFLKELTAALKEERAGNAVVGNGDESYCHQVHVEFDPAPNSHWPVYSFKKI